VALLNRRREQSQLDKAPEQFDHRRMLPVGKRLHLGVEIFRQREVVSLQATFPLHPLSDEVGGIHGRRVGRIRWWSLGEECEDRGADRVERDAEILQHTGGDALALAQQAEQQVLRTDVVMIEAPSLV
jgi:hypothetical protein